MTWYRSRGEPGRARHGSDKFQRRLWCSVRRPRFFSDVRSSMSVRGLPQGTDVLPCIFNLMCLYEQSQCETGRDRSSLPRSFEAASEHGSYRPASTPKARTVAWVNKARIIRKVEPCWRQLQSRRNEFWKLAVRLLVLTYRKHGWI